MLQLDAVSSQTKRGIPFAAVDRAVRRSALEVRSPTTRIRELRVRLLAILLLAFGTSTPAHAQSGDAVTDGASLDGQSAGTDDHGSSHIFWVLPAFNVEYGKYAQPLTTREKFDE